jgi:hypothetical protein
MMKNYRQLTESIRNQINPENYVFEKSFLDELSSISYSDALTFVRMAMKAVEPTYTQRTKEAGEKAKQHLDAELTDKTFKYQGSVMTDTHIKGYSDIDLLVISDKFYSYDLYRINQILDNYEQKSKFLNESIQKMESEKSGSSYSGDAYSDLKKLRVDSEEILKRKYSNCNISKPKAIKIKNLNLNREVDIVIANWYDDVTSIINNKKEYRGIQVYDKDNNTKCDADYPFLSIKRINEKSSETNGRLKKMIRFMKNIKAHSDYNIELSSFDINAICYDIKSSKYWNSPYYELISVVYNQLHSLCNDSNHANDLVSVDGREYIFRNQPNKVENLKSIMSEIESIYNDLKNVPIYG